MQDKCTQLNWRGRGYFEFPVTRTTSDVEDWAEVNAWSEFAEILASAKRGDFDRVHGLIGAYDNTDNWLIARACCDLMADAGSRRLFDEITPAALNVVEPTYAVHWGQVLCNWGNLRVVPVVLETLRALDGFEDAEDLAHDLNQLLEDEKPAAPPEIPRRGFGPFIAAANRRYQILANKFGTDDLIIFKGEKFSVERVAEVALSRLDMMSFDKGLRRKFEANTGIDCTTFFTSDGALKPLAAAAILESFFDDRDTVGQFLPGRRYFFGHPVPD